MTLAHTLVTALGYGSCTVAVAFLHAVPSSLPGCEMGLVCSCTLLALFEAYCYKRL